MHYHRILPLLLATCTLSISSYTFSQELVNLEQKPSPNSIVIKPFLKVPLMSLSFEPKSDDSDSANDTDNEVEYEPNVEPVFGASIGWKDFSFSASAPLSSSDEDLKAEGKTKYQEIDFQMMKEYWGFDLGWSTYRGFYRSDDETSGNDNEIKEQRPDLVKTGYFVNLFVMPFGRENDKWLWDTKNSEEGGQTRKFYVTPIAQVSYEDFKVSSNGSMIPKDRYSLFGVDSSMNTIDIHALGLAGGGIGTLCVDKMKFWMAITLGGSYHASTIRHDTRANDNVSGTSGPNTSIRLGFDFAQLDWHMGMTMLYDLKTYNFRATEIGTDAGSVTLYASKEIGI